MQERIAALRKVIEESIAAMVAGAVALPIDRANTGYLIEIGRQIQALETLKSHLPE